MSVTAPDVAPISADNYTPVSKFGAELIRVLAPWMTLHLAWLLDAIGVMVDPVYTLAIDQGVDDGSMMTVGTYDANGNLVTTGYQPGYGALLNPQVASGSELPYLGQFVGVSVPQGADDATARSLVVAEAGLNRGTNAAMIAAAQRHLAGSKAVTLFERTYSDGSTRNAGWFVMVVLTGEVVDLAGLIAAVNAVKLGGLMWALVQTSTWTIAQLEAAYATVGDVEAAFSTVAHLETDQVG